MFQQNLKETMSRQIKVGIESAVRLLKREFDAAFLFLPFASLHPLRLYLLLATSVTIIRDRSILRKVALLHGILLINLLKTIYLSVFLPPNPLDRVRLADIMFIISKNDFIYQIWIFCQALLLYFNYILLTVKPVFLCYIENLFFNPDDPYLKGINGKSRSPLKNCRQCLLWSLNLFGLLKILCDILFLVVCVTILSQIIDHPGDLLGNPLVSPLLFTWRILQLIVGLTGLFLAFFLYATVCPNVAAVGCATLTLLFLRLQLNGKQLTTWRESLRTTWTWPWIRYRAYNMKTFSLLFIANQVLGRLFVAFLAVNIPVSAYCLVFLVLGGLNLQTILGFILMMCQGFICTLPLHWIIARLTKQLHAPSKALLALSFLTNHRKGNHRARLTLHLAICHLHTNRKYGVTYGSFGLVTMGSFGKCMLLYSELILYSYKLIKGI